MQPEAATTPSGSPFQILWPGVFAGHSWRRHPEKRCSLSPQPLLAQETMIIRWKLFYKRQKNQPRKKHRSHPESQQTEPDASKKELELLKRHLQSIQSSFGHHSNETLVRALRRKEVKPLILRLARDFVCPSRQENQNQRPHPVANLEDIPPKWQNIQIDLAERSHPTDSLKHQCSVITDEGCPLEAAKSLFPLKDTDLQRNPVLTERRDFNVKQWVCHLEKTEKSACRQRRICSNVLRQRKCLAGTDSWTS